jgi:hypothetical protein
MRNAVSPEAKAVQFDTTEAPDVYRVCTIDADGGIVDLFDDIHDSQKAAALAVKLGQDHGLPVSRRTDHDGE